MSTTSRYNGLSESEAIFSRQQHGVNVLTPAARQSLWRRFLDKFRDPLIVILLIAGVLSIGISIYEYYVLDQDAGVFFEPVGIFIAILLATGLAFLFELKADKEFELLNQVNDDEPVTVIRREGVRQIPRRDVVVGDIVLLNTGEEIPADGELLEAVTLSVDESTLTGEPMCHKTTDPALFDADATFPSDHVMRGTKVMEGHGVMRVTAVGDATENGRVFEAAQIDNSVKTPLNEQLDGLGKLIARISYLVAAVIVAGRLLMYFMNVSFDWVGFIAYLLQTFMIAVTLVVVAVPEGLPMAVTLSLAYSMRRMLRTNNLVRKMHACETMGAATVICTDKTGTLTQNKMQVYRMDFFVPEQMLPLVYEDMAVNSTARLGEAAEVIGNPTEGALLLWLREKGMDYDALRGAVKVLEEIPFNTEWKYMASVVRRGNGQRVLYVKGAPEIVLGFCDCDDRLRSEVRDLLAGYQNQAMRTLGFAYRILTDGENPFADGRLVASGLTFAGIAAISDPVRADVPAAVAEVLQAGLKVKIVTGDTPATATEIGRQIGLWHDGVDTPGRNIVSGTDIAAMTDEELRHNVEDYKIIARARPMDKKRLVEALQANNEVVAVTGDGTNDAPALKAAQVGLSMGDGTSVAKEASDITIIDNSFASIGRAVMWGRSLYANIQRFILFQMTVNVVACLIVMIGSFMGMQSPLTVTQMLWVNLIMDTFAAMALASLPPSASVMKDKPRSRTAFIISRSMWRFIIGVGVLMTLLLLWLLYYLEHTPVSSVAQIFTQPMGGSNKGLSPYELSVFFTVFVLLQFWNMFNARAFATGRSAFHFKGCSGFLFIAVVIFVGQIAIVSLGGRFFNVVPLSLNDWCIIVGCTSAVLWIGELLRLMFSRRKS